MKSALAVIFGFVMLMIGAGRKDCAGGIWQRTILIQNKYCTKANELWEFFISGYPPPYYSSGL